VVEKTVCEAALLYICMAAALSRSAAADLNVEVGCSYFQRLSKVPKVFGLNRFTSQASAKREQHVFLTLIH